MAGSRFRSPEPRATTNARRPVTRWRALSIDVSAPRLGDLPDDRVVNFTYAYDWLANQTEWSDDAGAFYERSLGTQIRNGFTEGQANGGALRPTALYLASSVRTSAQPPNTSLDRGGWVRVRYGQSGNATSVTVRARCRDVSAVTACWDDTNESDVDDRASHLLTTCRCNQEQHYEYRWDELNRLAEARRYDRAGSGDWALQARQRYRYDAGNIRTLKETVDGQTADPSGSAVGGVERVALYVMPGDFERRGLVTNRITDTYDASLALGTETQYLVAGARVVWKPGAVGGGGTGFDRDARVTLAMTNLLQSTAGVVDLVTGALLEVATFYPNGARETLRANSDVEEFALEPVGFTGKEDDSEVGLVYFGMRYLMPHLGRWASPDPLQIHAGGGGEFGNSYHYVSGNLLQARDPLGLCEVPIGEGGSSCAEAQEQVAQDRDDELTAEREFNEGMRAAGVEHGYWSFVAEGLNAGIRDAPEQAGLLYQMYQREIDAGLLVVDEDGTVASGVGGMLSAELGVDPTSSSHFRAGFADGRRDGRRERGLTHVAFLLSLGFGGPGAGVAARSPATAAASVRAWAQSVRALARRALPLDSGNPWVAYQALITGSRWERMFRLGSRRVYIDGVDNGFLVEAKWAGNDRQWRSSPYHPEHAFYDVEKIVAQARGLIDAARAMGARGVRYAISNAEGAEHFNQVLRRELASEIDSGFLQILHVPGNGMNVGNPMRPTL